MIRKRNLVELACKLDGLPIFGCLKGSPAALAGVRYGDVLMAVDGEPTPTWDAYLRVRERSKETITLLLFRDGQELEVRVQLREGPPRSLADLLDDLEESNGLDSDFPVPDGEPS